MCLKFLWDDMGKNNEYYNAEAAASAPLRLLIEIFKMVTETNKTWYIYGRATLGTRAYRDFVQQNRRRETRRGAERAFPDSSKGDDHVDARHKNLKLKPDNTSGIGVDKCKLSSGRGQAISVRMRSVPSKSTK